MQYLVNVYAAACNQLAGPGWQMEAIKAIYPGASPNKAMENVAIARCR